MNSPRNNLQQKFRLKYTWRSVDLKIPKSTNKVTHKKNPKQKETPNTAREGLKSGWRWWEFCSWKESLLFDNYITKGWTKFPILFLRVYEIEFFICACCSDALRLVKPPDKALGRKTGVEGQGKNKSSEEGHDSYPIGGCTFFVLIILCPSTWLESERKKPFHFNRYRLTVS